jgi:6-pyruvoyltetrahydropterin/6-carboxytetrahydropterin synthase
MSFEVGVVAQFTAEHHLVGDFGPASQPHSHDYRVEACVSGAGLRPDGTLFDITELQAALAAAMRDLGDHDLNQVADLATPNPTAEVVARYIYHRVAVALAPQALARLAVRVWESPEAYASYNDELVSTSRK